MKPPSHRLHELIDGLFQPGKGLDLILSTCPRVEQCQQAPAQFVPPASPPATGRLGGERVAHLREQSSQGLLAVR